MPASPKVWNISLTKATAASPWVTIEVDMAHMHDRLQAYYDALRKHNITIDPRLVRQVPYGYIREAALGEIEDFFTDEGKTAMPYSFSPTTWACWASRPSKS